MNILCDACQTRYSISDALIPPQGARFKCRRCSNVIAIEPPVIELKPTELEVIPPPQAPAAPAPELEQASPPIFERSAPPAFDRAAEPTVFERTPEPAAETTPPPEPEFQQGFYSQPTPASARQPEPMAEEPELPPAAPGPSLAHEPSAFDSVTFPPRFSAPPSFAEPAPPIQAAAHRGAQADPPGPAVAASPDPPLFASPEPAAAIASPVPVISTIPSAGGTPIPDGLSPEERAKHEKARRLARVLASDIAIYNREKRDRGVKDGNLVAVLGYEIKKSWEIYKERVTPEFANATPYFRDALNEMLAEGKKIF